LKGGEIDMSLVVQSLVSANTAATSGSSSTSTGTTAAVPFAQTLVQTMGGNTANTTSVPADPLLGNLASLLQGLLKEVQTTGEKQGKQDPQNSNLLEKLTADVENLDESINSDPAMLIALQAWLLQVSALLSGSHANEGDTTSEAESAGSLSPLAQNADTLRFAVQDDLHSLVTLIQEAAVNGNEEVANKGISLLNNFTALLEQTASNADKGKGKNSSLDENSGVSVQQSIVTESNSKTTDKTLQNLSNRTGEAAAIKNEAVLTSPVTSGTVQDPEAEPTRNEVCRIFTRLHTRDCDYGRGS